MGVMREGLKQLLMVPPVLLAHIAHFLLKFLPHIAHFFTQFPGFLPEFLARLLALLYQQVNLAFDLPLPV